MRGSALAKASENELIMFGGDYKDTYVNMAFMLKFDDEFNFTWKNIEVAG